MSTGPGRKFLDLWRQRVSPVGASLLTLMWVLLWGDLSWGNVVAGLALALRRDGVKRIVTDVFIGY